MYDNNMKKLYHRRVFLKYIVTSSVVSLVILISLHKTRQAFRDFVFTDPQDLHEWEDHIQIAVVLNGFNDNTDNGKDLRVKFKNFVKSVVVNAQKYPIRFIFITDHKSVFQIEKTFQDILPPFILSNHGLESIVPRFTFQYINVQHVIEYVDTLADTMKKYINAPGRNLYIDRNGVTYAVCKPYIF